MSVGGFRFAPSIIGRNFLAFSTSEKEGIYPRKGITMSTLLSVVDLLKSLPKPSLKKIKTEELTLDPNIQIRFSPGENTFGFTTDFGDHAIQKLKRAIIDAGRILVPLVVWKKPVGESKFTYVVLQGNQRTKAAKALLADEETPKGVVDALKTLECNVYEDITKDQALALVDDQSSVEGYKKVDFVNLAWKFAATGMDYKEIGLATARLYADYVGRSAAALAKLKEINECKTRSEQLAIVGVWMRGGLDQGILDARHLGVRVREAFLLTVADEDNLITEGMKKASFNPKTRQLDPETMKKNTRIGILVRMKKEDPKWEEEGSPFNKMIDQFIAEDAGAVEKENATRPSANACLKLRDASKSVAMKTAYANAAGHKVESTEQIDNEAYRAEAIMNELAKIVNNVKNADVAATIAIILRSSNAVELTAQFQKYFE